MGCFFSPVSFVKSNFFKVLPVVICFFLATAQVSCAPPLKNCSKRANYHNSYAIVSSVPVPGLGVGVFGTAFPVTKDILLTAGHVCLSMIELADSAASGIDDSLVIFAKINSKGQFYDSEDGHKMGMIIGVDGDSDVCSIFSPEHGLAPLPITQTYNSLVVGDDVVVVSSPENVLYVKDYGTVISVTDEELIINIHIEHGSSGAPGDERILQ